MHAVLRPASDKPTAALKPDPPAPRLQRRIHDL